MKDQQFHFWQKFLTFANVMTVGIGLLVALVPHSFIFDLYNHYTWQVFFSGQPPTEEILRLHHWLYAIIGGTIVGFGVLMIMISENAFKKKERWAYWASWMGLLTWFIIDSSHSIYFGAIHNVVMINLVALVGIGLPLVMTRKAFK